MCVCDCVCACLFAGWLACLFRCLLVRSFVSLFACVLECFGCLMDLGGRPFTGLAQKNNGFGGTEQSSFRSEDAANTGELAATLGTDSLHHL